MCQCSDELSPVLLLSSNLVAFICIMGVKFAGSLYGSLIILDDTIVIFWGTSIAFQNHGKIPVWLKSYRIRLVSLMRSVWFSDIL